MGYHAGLTGLHRRGSVALLTLAFSTVMMLIADLDRPQKGFIRVSQQAMLDLQDQLDAK